MMIDSGAGMYQLIQGNAVIAAKTIPTNCLASLSLDRAAPLSIPTITATEIANHALNAKP